VRRLALLLVALGLPVAATAATSAPPSLAVKPGVVEYGKGEVVLSGVVPSKRAGEQVTILSQACRFTEPAPIGTATTRAGGAFRYPVQPMLNTSFRVRTDAGTSGAVRVGVKPIVLLTRVRAGRYRVEVQTTNPVFLDGKLVTLQRKSGARWVPLKRAKLAKASGETAITVLSAATIAVKATGVLRAVLPPAQAGCYLGAASAEVAA
jgi:hypothetical protein